MQVMHLLMSIPSIRDLVDCVIRALSDVYPYLVLGIVSFAAFILVGIGLFAGPYLFIPLSCLHVSLSPFVLIFSTSSGASLSSQAPSPR
jgi:hypothetical protein